MANHGIKQFETWCQETRDSLENPALLIKSVTTNKEDELLVYLSDMGRYLEVALSVVQMYRKRVVSPNRPARVSLNTVPMTASIRHEIRKLHKKTKLTQQAIASVVGVNQGRVNETLNRAKI